MSAAHNNRILGAVLIAFWAGIVAGVLFSDHRHAKQDDYASRAADLASCDYEEQFLRQPEIGFTSRQNCIDLHVALAGQYANDCLKEIRTKDDAVAARQLLDECIYYSLAKTEIPTRQAYIKYLRGKQ